MTRCKKGFTLIEIMIVVAIISLLAAIAIPNLMRARINTNEQAIRKELKTFCAANESFRAFQNPPVYATNIAQLTSAGPPYLDATWNNPTRHGFTITYAGGGAGILTYSVFAQALQNLAINDYCIDNTGVIFQGGAGGAAGCAGGTAIT